MTALLLFTLKNHTNGAFPVTGLSASGPAVKLGAAIDFNP